jgi:hypothetical protein
MLIEEQFASLGGFLFGYDQGVVSGVLTMESFGAKFPKIYADAGFKGWWVSTILLSKLCSISIFCKMKRALIMDSCMVRISRQWTCR